MGKEYKQNDLYVIELDEHEWYGPNVDREELQGKYRETARANLCALVAVFVIPDVLFPMCGHTRKHKVYEHHFPAADSHFKVQATFTGVIDGEIYTSLSERQRSILVRKVRDEVNEHANGVPGRYTISLDNGVILETGRV